MMHFNIEVEIDRVHNTFMNLSIFKFIIQDMCQDYQILPQFRVYLTSYL
jgi:hypothetical protein